MSEDIVLPNGSKGIKRLDELKAFADAVKRIEPSFKMSIRGWCYYLEGQKVITKGEFSKVEKIIKECREKGCLPINFVTEDTGRDFNNLYDMYGRMPIIPDKRRVIEHLQWSIETALKSNYEMCDPSVWDGEEYYIQMLVEKVDLKTLFGPICNEYHIAIGNAKGWSSALQVAEYARRFKEAEKRGLKCVLLYCGDHDPTGLLISDSLKNNISKWKDVVWGDGLNGYDPKNLIIERFGLNYEFIQDNQLVWIDGLDTGSGGDLSKPSHPDHHKPYVQEYIAKYGPQKCEANALIKVPDKAEELCVNAIQKYLGKDYSKRRRENSWAVIEKYRRKVDAIYNNVLNSISFDDGTSLNDFIQIAKSRVDNALTAYYAEVQETRDFRERLRYYNSQNQHLETFGAFMSRFDQGARQ